MGDSGQRMTKICFSIIHCLWKKARATYSKGGVLSKGFKYVGVNKCIVCFCDPEIKEDYKNFLNYLNEAYLKVA